MSAASNLLQAHPYVHTTSGRQNDHNKREGLSGSRTKNQLIAPPSNSNSCDIIPPSNDRQNKGKGQKLPAMNFMAKRNSRIGIANAKPQPQPADAKDRYKRSNNPGEGIKSLKKFQNSFTSKLHNLAKSEMGINERKVKPLALPATQLQDLQQNLMMTPDEDKPIVLQKFDESPQKNIRKSSSLDPDIDSLFK